MSRTVYVGRPGFPRYEASEREIVEAIEANTASATEVASDGVVAGIADAMRTIDEPRPLRATRYTFGYGVEVRHGSQLLDNVEVLGLQDALNRIEREQQGGGDSLEFSVRTHGELPGDLIFGRKGEWADYGFVIVEEGKWGPLMSSEPGLVQSIRTRHRITPKRIAEILTLTTNAQVGLRNLGVTTFGKAEQRLLRGVFDMEMRHDIPLPTDLSFGLTRPGAAEIYDWHIRVNAWERDCERMEADFGVLVGEASKGHFGWRRHDDEKEIMALGRCLESMWAPGLKRGGKRARIRDGCRRWMMERNQRDRNIEAVIELLDRFYDMSRNLHAHEATGQALTTDVERAHLNARIRGIVQDYIWWNLTGEMTQSRPRIISRGEEGGTHTMLWTQMWSHWKERGVPVEEIVRLWT